MKSMTFWKLYNEYYITIPIIQRDYSQGRTAGKSSKEIQYIREELVKKLINAIKDEKTELMLNFVYGKKEKLNQIDTVDNLVFIPVDGQQRLTTLYLLHWYIFAKAKIPFEKPFLYKSRKTTEDFCERISQNPRLASNDINFIRDEIWFNHSHECDPSVCSMLTMLKTIENESHSQNLDYERAAKYLMSEDCLVKFVHLELEEFDDEDLYIKMNSRGKRLTDFEIFKAKLQDSKALKSACENDYTEIVKYIGRFNNEYCDLFYQLDTQNFDKMMMRFVQDTIKYDHYIATIKKGKTAEEYRGDYNNKIIYDMSGGMFFDNYVDNPLEHISKRTSQCIDKTKPFEKSYHKDSIVCSLKKMDTVLEYLSAGNTAMFELTPLKKAHQITIAELFSLESGLPKDALRYAVTEFIFLMNPKTPEHHLAYLHWIRFVKNIIENTDFRSSDIAANVLVLFHDILEKLYVLKESKNDYDYKDVLQSISQIEQLDVSSQIEQKEEEQEKARLMTLDDEWENSILAAEEYFNDGQISFLLDFSKGNISDFNKYFETSKELLDSDKKSKTPDYLFHQALLSISPDNTENSRSYLTRDERTDYSMRWELSFKQELNTPYSRYFIKELFNKLFGCLNLSSKMKEIIDDRITNPFVEKSEIWKNIILYYQLPIKWKKYNTTKKYDNLEIRNYLSFNNDNSVVLLLNKQQTGSMNIDINTFLLYMEVADKGVDLRFYNTTKLMDDDNKPLRYVEKNGIRIGYDYTLNCYVNLDPNDVNEYQLKDVVNLLK